MTVKPLLVPVPAPAVGASRSSRGLVRGLGLWSSTAIVVGTMIGTGVFLKPSEIAREAGSMEWALVAWVLGALLSLLGALCYVELGAAMPEAGADYVYLTRGLHPVFGFLYGWKGTVVSGPASTAALAAGVSLFAGFFWPGLQAEALRLGAFGVSGGQVLSVLVILAVCGVNCLAVRQVGRIQILLTSLKVLALVAVVGAGLFLSDGTGALHQQTRSAAGTWSLGGFTAAVTASLWAYSGWHTIFRVGGEVKDPGRTLPRAAIGGFLATAAIFLLVNLACFSVLRFDEVVGSTHVVSDMLERATGGGVAGLLTVAMIVSALGSLNASMLGSSRIPYAMARDGLLPRPIGITRAGAAVPSGAVVYTSLFAVALVLTGSFEDLTSLFVFTQWLFFALSIIALFRLRRVKPDLPRPARVWGYPGVPALFVALSLGLSVSLFLQRPLQSGLGLLAVVAGVLPWRWLESRRHPSGGSR